MSKTSKQKFKLPPRDYYRLDQAADLLGCTADDLVHWGERGHIRLMAYFDSSVWHASCPSFDPSASPYSWRPGTWRGYGEAFRQLTKEELEANRCEAISISKILANFGIGRAEGAEANLRIFGWLDLFRDDLREIYLKGNLSGEHYQAMADEQRGMLLHGRISLTPWLIEDFVTYPHIFETAHFGVYAKNDFSIKDLYLSSIQLDLLMSGRAAGSNSTLEPTLPSENRIDRRRDNANINIIGSLLDIIAGRAPGFAMHPDFTSEGKLIEAISDKYKDIYGLSQRNLTDKFAEAKKGIGST